MKQVFSLPFLFAIITLPSCNVDNANDNDNGVTKWPDVSANLIVTGDVEHTLSFTNEENGLDDDNINAIYDHQTGELTVHGFGPGAYTWNYKVLSDPVPSVSDHAITAGLYLAGAGTAESVYFDDLDSGIFNLASSSLLEEDLVARMYRISGSFEMVLTNDESGGTVNVSGNFTDLVLVVPK